MGKRRERAGHPRRHLRGRPSESGGIAEDKGRRGDACAEAQPRGNPGAAGEGEPPKAQEGPPGRFGVWRHGLHSTRDNGLGVRVSNMRHTCATWNAGESGLKDEVRPGPKHGRTELGLVPRGTTEAITLGGRMVQVPAGSFLFFPAAPHDLRAPDPEPSPAARGGMAPADASSCPAPRASPRSVPGPPIRASLAGSCSWSPVRCARG